MPDSLSLGTAYPIYMYLVHFEIKCTVCKLRIKFYSVDFLNLSSENSLSALKDCSEEVKGAARIYRSFCNKKTGSQNIKRLLFIKENELTNLTS